MRDNQRSRLYAAERMAFGSPWEYPPDYKTMPECEAFVASVLRHKIFQRHYPEYESLNLLLRPGKRVRSAFADTREIDGVVYHAITLPKFARSKHMILHELAHHLNNLRNPGDKEPHGHEFAAIYIDLVHKFLGIDTYRELRRCFTKKKVRTWERKPSAHSEEHRKMLADRMRGFNAARNAARQNVGQDLGQDSAQ